METAATPQKKVSFKKFLSISLLVIVAGLFIFYFVCGLAYSEGTRSGVLTKVSKRGFLFKTYEGELYIGGMNEGEGTMVPGNVFQFSCKNQEVYDKLESLQGRKVVVHYKQVIKNLFWQGDTDYFVHDATLATHP